ncbi:hypothetical protein ACFTZJ_09175 [Streptomyces globisporus]|uniref:hypothetical protein n=1 Tax=Streptomyces globisporus TaxID=1908 RepID=UPI003633AA3B
MDDLLAELAYVKTRRRELRSAEYVLAEKARAVASRAFTEGMPAELVAERLGYNLKVILKWQKSAAPPRKQWAELIEWRGRMNLAVRDRDAKSARRRLRLLRTRSRGGRDGWKARGHTDPDGRQGDCNM